MSNIKRLYFYGVAFAALLVAANGVSTMLGPLIGRVLSQHFLVGNIATPVSLGLAMIIPGIPLWLLHWSATQRYVARGQEEPGSALRKLYLYAVLFIAAVVALTSAMPIIRWFLGTQDGGSLGDAFARFLVWGVVWSYHWRVEGAEGQPTADAKTLRRWYLYVTSAYGLATLVVGIGMVVAVLLGGIYAAIFPGITIGGAPSLWREITKQGIAFIALGGLWWGFHWIYAARGDQDSVLRQVYLYLFAVLGGIATVLVTLGILLYQVLRFLLGGVDVSAQAHFQFLSGVLSPLLVGGGLWVYHWRIVQEEGARVTSRLMGAGRSYRYIMAALGLSSLCTGTTILIGVLIGFLDSLAASPLLYAGHWWQSTFSASLSTLIVGLPVWVYYWNTAQATALQGNQAERSALPRRLFLYLVLGAAMLGLLVNLSFVLFRFLDGLIQGTLSMDVLRNSRWNLGVLATAAVFLGYYWNILRQDQSAGAEAASRRKEVLVLVSEKGATLLSQLEEALGTRSRVLYDISSDEEPPALSPEQLQQLSDRVAAAPGRKVLLVVGSQGVTVHPYRD